jgi:alpha-galactosidase
LPGELVDCIGLFNRSKNAAEVDINWAELQITGKRVVRNLWNQKNEGLYQKKFVARVPSQVVVMIKIMKK